MDAYEANKKRLFHAVNVIARELYRAGVGFGFRTARQGELDMAAQCFERAWRTLLAHEGRFYSYTWVTDRTDHPSPGWIVWQVIADGITVYDDSPDDPADLRRLWAEDDRKNAIEVAKMRHVLGGVLYGQCLQHVKEMQDAMIEVD